MFKYWRRNRINICKFRYTFRMAFYIHGRQWRTFNDSQKLMVKIYIQNIFNVQAFDEGHSRIVKKWRSVAGSDIHSQDISCSRPATKDIYGQSKCTLSRRHFPTSSNHVNLRKQEVHASWRIASSQLTKSRKSETRLCRRGARTRVGGLPLLSAQVGNKALAPSHAQLPPCLIVPGLGVTVYSCAIYVNYSITVV